MRWKEQGIFFVGVSALKIEWLRASVSTVTKHAPITTVSNSPAFSTRTDAFGICPPPTNERIACLDEGLGDVREKNVFRLVGNRRLRDGGEVVVVVVVVAVVVVGGGSGDGNGDGNDDDDDDDDDDNTTTTKTTTTVVAVVPSLLCVRKRA
ncbi:hypothetical protein HZH68_003526 [Vespula germanica]|uniref:Uncharacterized protein n=1 Tax=Vespula germanica TaxID=30212 RepID=A0A834NPC2_VESGE|nr:hypothetical protein HZH68_003526 [Vespula germanica]